jgi:hypothetical protein
MGNGELQMRVVVGEKERGAASHRRMRGMGRLRFVGGSGGLVVKCLGLFMLGR